jgi:hypothetical protein
MPDFASKYQVWVVEHLKADPDLRRELQAEFRKAWDQGDLYDQYAVLHFILSAEETSGFDLILEAIRNRPALASQAVAVASALIARHYNLGSDIRDLLEKFRRDHPEAGDIASYSIELLDQEKRDSIG